MLAKIWKKLLLAVCIIACLYNVMHKLVTRTSLEIQIQSIKNQTSIMDSIDSENEIDSTENKADITNESIKNNAENKVTTNENTVKEDKNSDSIVVIY